MHNNTYMNTQAELSSGTGVNDDAVLPFVAGKKYRIRIINMSALASECPKGPFRGGVAN